MNELLLFSVDSPLQAGIYQEKKLIQTFECQGRVGEELYPLLEEILEHYELSALYHLQGPGSFTAIKLTHLFLRTLSIALKIPLYGTDSFAFNGGAPIKAYGDSYFIKKGREIEVCRLCSPPSLAPWKLPLILDDSLFSLASEPLYVLPPL